MGLQFSTVKGIHSLSNYQIMLYRSFPFLLSIPFISWHKGHDYDISDVIYNFIYAFTNVTEILLAYVALEFAQVGNVVAVIINLPVPSSILGFIFLRETLTRYDVIIIVINATGICLIAKPPFIFGSSTTDPFADTEFLGIVIAVVSLLMMSIASLASRKLGYRGNADPALLTTLGGMTAVVVSGAILLATNTWDNPSSLEEVILVCLVSSSSFFGNIFFVLGYTYESIATVSVLITISVPLSYAGGVLLYGEIPELVPLIGVALTLVSTMGSLLKKGQDSHR